MFARKILICEKIRVSIALKKEIASLRIKLDTSSKSFTPKAVAEVFVVINKIQRQDMIGSLETHIHMTVNYHSN